MSEDSQEIELKLRIEDKQVIIDQLVGLGAELVSKKQQIDILYNSKYFDFGDYDQSLRLRTEKWNGKEKAKLAFKGTPKHTKEGHKVRDEFETEVDGEATRKILISIGFEEVAVIEKERESYRLGSLDVVIDELKFGTFIEFEGEPGEIERVRKKLGLGKAEPVKKGYIFLQLEWEKNQKRKIVSWGGGVSY